MEGTTVRRCGISGNVQNSTHFLMRKHRDGFFNPKDKRRRLFYIDPRLHKLELFTSPSSAVSGGCNNSFEA